MASGVATMAIRAVSSLQIISDGRAMRSSFGAKHGRNGGIRTRDPQSPRLMRYQAALHPVTKQGLVISQFPEQNQFKFGYFALCNRVAAT